MKLQTISLKSEWYERPGYCSWIDNTHIISTRRENTEKQKLFNKITTRDWTWGKRTNNKQQTTTLYVIAYEKRPIIQPVEHYEQVTVQNGISNDSTKRTMIRTTWILLLIWQYKHHINEKEKNSDKQKLFNKNKTQDKSWCNIIKSKQQTTSWYLIAYKQQKTIPKIQVIQNYEQVAVHYDNTNIVLTRKRNIPTNKSCSTKTKHKTNHDAI